MIFTGHYEHMIDAKNRLAIPSKIRARMDPKQDGRYLVIVPGRPEGTLWLYTEHYFERLANQTESTLIPDEDQHRFEQIFFTLAEMLEIDTQGRILIPEKMLARTNLGRDVVICGVRDHLEIYPRKDFEARIDESWRLFREYQDKAQDAFRDSRRQSGREAGET